MICYAAIVCGEELKVLPKDSTSCPTGPSTTIAAVATITDVVRVDGRAKRIDNTDYAMLAIKHDWALGLKYKDGEAILLVNGSKTSWMPVSPQERPEGANYPTLTFVWVKCSTPKMEMEFLAGVLSTPIPESSVVARQSLLSSGYVPMNVEFGKIPVVAGKTVGEILPEWTKLRAHVVPTYLTAAVTTCPASTSRPVPITVYSVARVSNETKQLNAKQYAKYAVRVDALLGQGTANTIGTFLLVNGELQRLDVDSASDLSNVPLGMLYTWLELPSSGTWCEFKYVLAKETEGSTVSIRRLIIDSAPLKVQCDHIPVVNQTKPKEIKAELDRLAETFYKTTASVVQPSTVGAWPSTVRANEVASSSTEPAVKK
jgi:hypothetical protein